MHFDLSWHFCNQLVLYLPLSNRASFLGFITPVWISLKTAIAATTITFCLGVTAAWWMKNYRGRAKGIIEGIFTAPLVLPPTVVGFLLLLMLGRNGAIGQFLDLLGIRVIFTWYATVIAAVVVAFPLMYKSALAAFQQSDRHNLIACARTLGASETTIFWRIILPLAKPGLIAGILLTFARALGEFGATLMLAGSIPGKTQTIPIAIFFAAESGAMDRALGLVIILLVISLGVIVGVNYVDRGERIRSKNRGYKQLPTTLSPSRDRVRRILEVDIQKQLPNFLLDITFKVDSEHPLGILGSSGAGKTTLLRCIAGLETPDRGRIVLDGKILYDSAKKINLPPQKRAVGFVFQDYALFPHLSVADNIAFGMPKERSPSVISQDVVHQLQQMNLSRMSDRMTTQLSGGEQQRVALARVLASNPDITLLDEPFSALDSNLKTQLLKLWQKLLSNYSGLTVYVTHNLSEAYRLCPQLLIVDRGKAIACGKREDILYRPPNLQTAKIIGCNNISAAKKIAPKTITAIDWQCDLQIPETTKNIQHIAIHSHSIIFTQDKQNINTFPVWLATSTQIPHQVTLYLKLHSSPINSDDYNLLAEISQSQWQQLQQQTLPWYIQIPPSQIIIFVVHSS